MKKKPLTLMRRANNSSVRLVEYWRITYRCGHSYDHARVEADILGLSRRAALAISKERCSDCQLET